MITTKLPLIQHLRCLIKESVDKEFGIKLAEEDIAVNIPQRIEFGDYTTNVCFQIASRLKKSPVHIAKELSNKINDDSVYKVEPVSGYLNIHLKPGVYWKIFNKSFEKNLFEERKESILIEFGQPNTHKKPHVGHLFSYILGESLARILEFLRFRVIRANYQGDVGLNIAKALYAVIKNKKQYNKLLQAEDTPEIVVKRIEFLQNCYVQGNNYYKNDQHKKDIDKLNRQIYESDPKIQEIYQTTRKWSIDFYKMFEKILRVRFDKYYFESQTFKVGKEIVLKNLGKVFTKSQGAIVFKGEKYSLHTRVFITKQKVPTYEAKDLGLVKMKLQDFDPDYLLISTAKEQSEYFKVIIKTAEILFPKIKQRFLHIPFGMVNLTTGKISSRKGNIIGGWDIFVDVKKKILQAYDLDEETAEKLAISAIKYSFLYSEREKDLQFDPEKSIAKEGSSGPYLLYSLARAKSILKKSPEKIYMDEKNFSQHIVKLDLEEKFFARRLFYFKEAVIKSALDFSPHHLTGYLFTLSQDFNTLYQKYPVLAEPDKIKRSLRLYLTYVYEKTLETGLKLLGIPSVEKL